MSFTDARPGSFRRRLTLSFVFVAALSSGVLALTAFFLVKQDRQASFIDRSMDKARLAASLAEARLSEPVSADEISDLIATLHRRTGMEVIASWDGRSLASRQGFDEMPFLDELRNGPEEEGMERVEANVDDVTYLVVHPTDSSLPDLYFLFSEENLIGQMSRFSTLLWRVWFGVALVAALVGNLVARTTLRPIARASTAATALAEGMLDTRLPIERADEFGVWAASFNEMAAALEQKINELEAAAERERQFTSDVAHELRTPLSALVTSTQLLAAEGEEMGPQAAWAAERLAVEVQRLRRLVEELLEISRLDVGREAVSVQQIDLHDWIGRLLAHHGWGERVRAELDRIEIRTDPRRLDRVLSNLISNALEHGEEPVSVRGAVENSSVVIQVQDRGPGIREDVAPHVFERFYKGDPARSGGSGLGLAIAQENARLLGGEIAFESRSEGATFIARFPKDSQSPTTDHLPQN